MRSPAARRLIGAFAVIAFVLAACGGGGAADAAGFADLSAGDVRPPPRVDTKRSGLPGVVVATNSPSLRRLAGAPEGPGAVILFVEPGGPTDGLGVGRGDVITAVAGQKVTNHSRALALLHDQPGKEIEVSIRHRDARERTIKIKPREPLVASLRQYLNPLVAASPKDPILRFVRAQTPGVLDARLADINAALNIDKRFVEALTLGSSLLWDHRRSGDEGRPAITNALEGWKKALEVDPDNSTTLTTRSTVLSIIGNAQQARRDATKAVEIDQSHPRAYYALGVAEEALKHPDRAAGPARAAIELDPFNIQHWRLLARIFAALKRKNDCQKTAAAFTPFLQARNFDQEAATLRKLCS
jgi:hypothetical protein